MFTVLNVIGGEWVDSVESTRLDITNPATGDVIGTVPVGGARDIDAAVAAARRAFPAWAARPLAERVATVEAIADAIEQRAEEFGKVIVAELGAPARLVRWAHVGLGVADLRGAVASADKVAWEEPHNNSIIVREPIGVAGCITPWNYPLHQITAKLGSALIAGCTMVIKPSEVAPITAHLLMEVIESVGVPAGVVNMVNGLGPNVGAPLAAHDDVDIISFTGSTKVGQLVSELAAPSVKRVALELGGKSASVILEDADLTEAVPKTLRSSFLNGGQSCNAQTRMVVPRSRLAEVEALLVDAVAEYRIGDPTDPATRLGPMVTEAQRNRVLSYIELGSQEGATLLIGGTECPEGLEAGFFVQPTVFTNVDPFSRLAQEEIFGPVLSVIPVDSEQEAIEIANSTDFGIGGGVWAGDLDHAIDVARQIRTAQLDVNGGSFNPTAPFGGYGKSGNTRENGVFGIEEYLEIKSIQLPQGAGR